MAQTKARRKKSKKPVGCNNNQLNGLSHIGAKELSEKIQALKTKRPGCSLQITNKGISGNVQFGDADAAININGANITFKNCRFYGEVCLEAVGAKTVSFVHCEFRNTIWLRNSCINQLIFKHCSVKSAYTAACKIVHCVITSLQISNSYLHYLRAENSVVSLSNITTSHFNTIAYVHLGASRLVLRQSECADLSLDASNLQCTTIIKSVCESLAADCQLQVSGTTIKDVLLYEDEYRQFTNCRLTVLEINDRCRINFVRCRMPARVRKYLSRLGINLTKTGTGVGQPALLSYSLGDHDVMLDLQMLTIGCTPKSFADWEQMTDDAIRTNHMDSNVAWAHKYRATLQALANVQKTYAQTLSNCKQQTSKPKPRRVKRGTKKGPLSRRCRLLGS